MTIPLDEETRSLLETLASGFYRDELCMCCGTQVSYSQEAITNVHTEECPVRRARSLLELNGTPVKMWIISYSQRRTDNGRISNASLPAIRCALSTDDALKLVKDNLVFQGKRVIVEGSIEFQEIAM